MTMKMLAALAVAGLSVVGMAAPGRRGRCRSSSLTRPGQSICPTTGCSAKYPASLWIPTTMYG